MVKRPNDEGTHSTDLDLPDQVIDVLKTTSIGYLSVISKSGELYSYPIAYYYSQPTVHFVTPVSAAKYKIIKNNPKVSFIVDNSKVTTDACGAMLQGRAKIFSVGRTFLNILSLAPKISGFSRKYPGMLSFYAKGKELPDERKLYKYRLIRITPSKIVYWVGYSFGRWTGKDIDDSDDSLDLPNNESSIDTVAFMFQPTGLGPRRAGSHDWLTRLDNAPYGFLSNEESKILRGYQTASRTDEEIPRARTSNAERTLLKKAKSKAATTGK